MKKFILFSTAFIFLYACNNSKKSSAGEAGSKAGLKDVYWKLNELNGNAVANDGKNGPEIYLVLYTAENRAAGNAGCNRYTGKYELNDNGFNIKFTPFASTKMACPAMETEQAYLKIFEMADSYYVTDTSLQLNRGKMAPLARFTAVKEKSIN